MEQKIWPIKYYKTLHDVLLDKYDKASLKQDGLVKDLYGQIDHFTLEIN